VARPTPTSGSGGNTERVEHDQSDATADQDIEKRYLGRRGRRYDEDRRYGRLGHQQFFPCEDDHGRHRQHHQQSNLGQPSPDRTYEQVGQHDSQHYVRDHLHGRCMRSPKSAPDEITAAIDANAGRCSTPNTAAQYHASTAATPVCRSATDGHTPVEERIP
jgi:hypothetical protein